MRRAASVLAITLGLILSVQLSGPPPEAAADIKSSYRCADICKYAQSALWYDINGPYRVVHSVRYRGGTDDGDCGDSQIDRWYVSGSDVRRDSNGDIKWFIDRLPASSSLTNCHPFDAGGLVAANPNVGRNYALQVRIKWDYEDDGPNSPGFTIFDCWRLNTSLTNSSSSDTC